MTPFRDRVEAGRILAGCLMAWADCKDVLVLALPRGGVPVGFEVAQALQAPLDVFLVRKLGVPGQEELAMGAIAGGGTRVLNDEVVRGIGIPPHVIARVSSVQALELERRERLYRDGRPAPRVSGRTVILIDDGLATGASMRAAARALRQRQPARLILAVPVAAADTCEALALEADEVICARMPEPFYAVGYWYRNFAQTTDAEVCTLLAQAETLFPKKEEHSMTMEELRQSPAPGLSLEPGELDIITEAPYDDSMDGQPDGDRQLTTDSDAIDEGNTNSSDLGSEVAGDIGPKHG